MTAPAAAQKPDLRLAQALVAAERRLAMLERLAEMAMAIAAELTEKIVEFPHKPGSGPQGARAFAQVSRAVRLTLTLAARVEKAILAMRKGELRLDPAEVSGEAAISPEVRGERVRAAVSSAIERDAADAEDADMLRGRLDERLAERDDFGAFLSLPFEACVLAICRDLGIDPEPVLAMEGGEEDSGVLLPSRETVDDEVGRMRGRRDLSANVLSGIMIVPEAGATPHPTRSRGPPSPARGEGRGDE